MLYKKGSKFEDESKEMDGNLGINKHIVIHNGFRFSKKSDGKNISSH